MGRYDLTMVESMDAATKCVQLLNTDRDAEALAVLAARRRARLAAWLIERYPDDIIRMGMVMAAAAERARAVALIVETDQRD